MTEKLSKDLRASAIISAAVEEFLEKGYSGTSMDAIAVRAGISKGGLYHHFRNKDEILLHANRVFTSPVSEMMEELAGRENAVDGLMKYISDYINYWDIHRMELQFFFLSMNKSFGNSVLLNEYREYFRQELSFFEHILEYARSHGQLQFDSAQPIAFSLISAMDGSLAYLLIDQALDAATIIHHLQHQFLSIYLPKS